ncbi:MAG: nucleotide exchange factor GrpE [Chthoniobacterales bacterium]
MTEDSANPAAESDEAADTPANPEDTQETYSSDAGAPASLEDEVLKYRDISLRAQAELDNFRKRAAREREESIRYANTSLLDRLLPVLDNFELGLDAASKATDASGILQGMSMVRKQLQDFLRDSGVEPIEAEGQAFDPNLHDALGQEASEDVPEGTVLRQLRKGFKLRDRLLRPATVIVSKGPEAAADPKADSAS